MSALAPPRSACSEAFQRLEQTEDLNLGGAVAAGTEGVVLWGCAETRLGPAVSSENFRAVLIVFLLLPNPQKLSRPEGSECRLHICLPRQGSPLVGNTLKWPHLSRNHDKGGLVPGWKSDGGCRVPRDAQERVQQPHHAQGKRGWPCPCASFLPSPAAGPAGETWILFFHSGEKQLEAGGASWQTGRSTGLGEAGTMCNGRTKEDGGEEQELQVWAQSCLR